MELNVYVHVSFFSRRLSSANILTGDVQMSIIIIININISQLLMNASCVSSGVLPLVLIRERLTL